MAGGGPLHGLERGVQSAEGVRAGRWRAGKFSVNFDGTNENKKETLSFLEAAGRWQAGESVYISKYD